jgi:hypothetical protein
MSFLFYHQAKQKPPNAFSFKPSNDDIKLREYIYVVMNALLFVSMLNIRSVISDGKTGYRHVSIDTKLFGLTLKVALFF